MVALSCPHPFKVKWRAVSLRSALPGTVSGVLPWQICPLQSRSVRRAMSAALPFPLSRLRSFPDILSPTTPTGPLRTSVSPCGERGSALRGHANFALHQRARHGSRSRIVFSCHYGLSGCFRCFPPRLAATRLLQLLAGPTAAGGPGLSPGKSAPLGGALARTFQSARHQDT